MFVTNGIKIGHRPCLNGVSANNHGLLCRININNYQHEKNNILLRKCPSDLALLFLSVHALDPPNLRLNRHTCGPLLFYRQPTIL